MEKKGLSGFYDMSVFVFDYPVLLRCMRARSLVKYIIAVFFEIVGISIHENHHFLRYE